MVSKELEDLRKAEDIYSEAAVLNSKNEALKEMMYSKETALIVLSREMKLETERLQKLENSVTEEKYQLEVLRKNIQLEFMENQKKHARIQESLEDAQNISDDIQKQRQDLETKISTARSELSSLDYKVWEEKQLIILLRQALHTFCQINGTAIKIPELTDDHRWLIIDFLKSEITPIPVKSTANPDQITAEEEQEEVIKEELIATEPVETIKELRTVYEERFWKRPFNGWNTEQLLSKLK